MADEILVEGQQYISSKRASESTGYSQDYIGQLARKGLIDSKRIGGLWYISNSSLATYKERAESSKNKSVFSTAPSTPAQPIEAVVSFDGKDYISAGRAAELTGYHQDYVGQLARGGKVLSRQIGNRWYVERQGILSHKKEKDSLLAAVQAEAVGLLRAHESLSGRSEKIARKALYEQSEPQFTYVSENSDLMPVFKPSLEKESDSEEHKVPIRVLQESSRAEIRGTRNGYISKDSSPWKTGISWAVGSVATIVIVLAIGYVSVANSARYTQIEAVTSQSASALMADATEIFSVILDRLEEMLAPEIIYDRFSN